MIANKEHKRCGIYCIRNKINNKVYIGKSKNIYQRIIQHKYHMKTRNLDENPHLINAYNKYGIENFEYFVIEFLEKDEKLVSERELFWMKTYKSLDREFGYNIRSDSSSKMIVHLETSEKISQRLKKEWKEGIRSKHGEKLSNNWKNNPNRVIQQSSILSKIKTKYKYLIFDTNNNFIKEGFYSDLKELKIQGVQHKFARYKVDFIKFKDFYVKRVKIKDIVRSS